MPAGPVNCEVACGKVEAGPEMVAVGIGLTVNTASEVLVQPLACTTVNRSVALEDET